MHPLTDTLFTLPTGPIQKKFSPNITIGKIFDVLWNQMTESILQTTAIRESNFSLENLNLFLASTLVMGLAPEPEIEDYFYNDSLSNEFNIVTSLKSTQLEIIDQLTGNTTLREDELKPIHLVRMTGFGFFPEKQDKSGDCTQCKKDDIRSKTSYMCSICKVRLHADCFSTYHK